MNLRLQRAQRKLLRPLRRLLQATPAQEEINAFDSPCLVLIAHPDDEVFCSGLICELLQRGQEVHLLCFTRGEGGERGQLPPESTLAEAREREMTAAAEALGVTSLKFLDYCDPAMKEGKLSEPAHEAGTLSQELTAHLAHLKIGHLLTHGSSGEYWHPAHLCLHRQARALARQMPALQLWTFNAWQSEHPLPAVLNQDDPSHLRLDATSHSAQREHSLACHHSQVAVFERFAQGSLADFIALTAHEHYRKW